MTRNVLVRVIGYQRDTQTVEEEEHEAIEIITPGQYFYRGGKHYILYEEVAEGVPDVTKNQIKICNYNRVEVTKKGVINSKIIFEKGEIISTDYETPFGMIPMDVMTENVRLQVQEDKIEIGLVYQLLIQHDAASDCTLTMEITAVK